MQKVDGVERARVSLKEGLTILDLKAGNRVTLAKLREVIKNNGFVSKEAQLLAAGTPRSDSAGERFEVSGTGEQLRSSTKPVADASGQWRFTSPAK